MNDERAIVNISIKRTAPAFQVGKTGQTLFGTDQSNPWGSMRHAFWPRCKAEGSVVIQDGTIDFTDAHAMYVYALQGMKPHHLAARWNFCIFMSPSISVSMMEFTTPPSYGNTTVNVGSISRDGEIVSANASGTFVHTKSVIDPKTAWPEPTAVKVTWTGKTKDGKDVEAVVEGDLGPRSDRVDIMHEVPGFLKQLVASAVGTKPYIYMVSQGDGDVDAFLLSSDAMHDPWLCETGARMLTKPFFLSCSTMPGRHSLCG